MTGSQKPLFSNQRLRKIIIPLLFEQYLAILVGMADTVMVSSVGEHAVSGVSLVNNLSAVMLNLFTALAAGGGIVTSQFIGAKRPDDAQRSTGQVITMSVGISVIIMSFCLIFSRPLLRLFFGDITEEVMQAATTYFFYNALSFPFLALYSAFSAILRADGNTKTAFYVSMVRNVTNIGGNALCVYALHMGVAGVAIPTALSRLVGAACMGIAVSKNHYPLHPQKQDIFQIQPKLMLRMLKVGLPTAIENSIFQLGRVITLSMISGFGTYQIAANSTANTLTNLTVATNTALSVAAMTVIGQCIGAQDFKQTNRNALKLLGLGYIGQIVFNSILLIWRYPFIGIFQNLSPETVELSA
ncbi:MAG: MATE family efflux transporter, partial [Clostridia bacterium]|nr:MATE family efflux transporter [Clostridia bacterium]